MAEDTFFDEEFAKEVASDDDVNEEEHGKLLQAVHAMDSKQRIKPPSRTEPSLTVSEFDLAPIKKGNVHLKNLARSLEAKGKPYDAEVASKIRRLTKTARTLSKPLEKNQQEKIKRVIAYKNLKKDVGRWDAIVQTNRTARSVTFPMNIEPLQLCNTSDYASLWQAQPQTPFEAGLYDLLGKSQVYQEDKKEEQKFRLSLAELREKRIEIAKLRARQSYEAAKARRQNKIKSKSYRRVLRREKMQKQLKDFETLQKTNPEEALKQLEELEKQRALERMTLRHKSTGHWARSRLIRAKYDTQTRRELAEQLAVSRDLTKKAQAANSSDEENDNETEVDQKQVSKTIAGDEDNPWIVKPESEVQDFISGYKRYWEELNKKDVSVRNDNEEETKMDDCVDLSNVSVSDETKNVHEQFNVNTDEPKDQPNCEDSEPKERNEERNDNEKEVNLDSFKNSSESMIDSGKSIDLRENDRVDGIRENDEMKVDTQSISKKGGKAKKGSDRVLKIKLKEKLKKKNVLNSVQKPKKRSLSSSWLVTPNVKDKANGNNVPKAPVLTKNTNSDVPKSDSKIDAFLSTCVSNTSKKISKKKKRKTGLDKMFDELENDISAKIEHKLKKLKDDLSSRNNRDLALKEVDKEDEDQGDDLGASLALKNTGNLRLREDTELIEGSEITTNGMEIADLLKKSSDIQMGTITKGSGGNFSDNKSSVQTSDSQNTPETNINPSDFIAAKPKVLLTAVPELMTAGEEAFDETMEEDQQNIITEAFADDNVVDEFSKEKVGEVKDSQPKDIDLSLPGWGEWVGKGAEPTKKKKRFILKAPPQPRRRDDGQETVFIREEASDDIRKLQVCELPKGFKSVSDFEASIRAPVGSTWVPQTAHRKFIKPTVVTKIGTIIKPMDEEFLVKKKTLVEFLE